MFPAVPPSRTSQPVITPFENKTLSTITWNFTNTTADAGPDYLVVTIDNHSSSPVRIDPPRNELLFSTEPGATYFVRVTAFNRDGLARSPAAQLSLDSTGMWLPLICAVQFI